MAGSPESHLHGFGWRNTNNRIQGGSCLPQFRNSDDPCAARQKRVANAGNFATRGARGHSRGFPGLEPVGSPATRAWRPTWVPYYPRPRATEGGVSGGEGKARQTCPRSRWSPRGRPSSADFAFALCPLARLGGGFGLCVLSFDPGSPRLPYVRARTVSA